MNIQKYIDNYLNNFKKYKNTWNYEDGCIYKGALDLYEATNEEKYLNFLIKRLNEEVMDDGTICNYKVGEYNIDNINSGKVLFDGYKITGDEKFKKAAELLMEQVKKHPRTDSGSFWHKNIYPNQIWLDGLYMVMPFYARFEKEFNDCIGYKDINNQFLNLKKFLWNEEKELFYHGYDESRKERWSNPETGVSQNFWSRAMGWLVMAMVDTIEIMDDCKEYVADIKEMFVESIKGLLKYQDKETSMWYQVIDAGNREGNYLESSGTLMIAYAILKGVRLGYLPQELKAFGEAALDETIKRYLDVEKNELGGICGVAGLGNTPYRDGTYEYYISERIIPNDPKGVGAFLMAYSEKMKNN